MALSAVFFYLFSSVLIAAAVMVIAARNPVHSVLWLILAFFNAAGLFILLGAEFLAMILVVVYVGAVAVLFLFVVMMLDVDFVELREGFLEYMPIGVVIGVILFAEMLFFIGAATITPEVTARIEVPIPNPDEITNAEAIGRVLYTDYILFFQIAGMVLLVAMIGAITLTLRHKEGVKRQNISDQVARTPATAIEVRKVDSGRGV
ncbi:MAG: NADH-quinone oxidoreductase subunit J [Pseudomonadota bacterium]